MHSAASNGQPGRARYPAFLLGSICGALLMYLLDPLSGRRRRALVRDQLAHCWRLANEAALVTARDVSNRLRGLSAETRRAMHRDAPSDDVLQARIRARIGRLVSHPHSIEVTVMRGQVRLEGPILALELDRLLHAVQRIPGVEAVDNWLTVYPAPGDVPGLQGGHPRRGDRFELLQDNWSPAARLVAGAAGGMLMMRRQGGILSTLGRVAGALLFARSVTNRDVLSLFSGSGEARPITVQKSIHIDASIDRVFDFWADVENFPRFMSRVREVRPESDSVLYWSVTGPAGLPVSWRAEITDFEPNDRIGWQTLPSSAVRHRGLVRFFRWNDSGTRVEVRLDYLPPAGALGHFAALLFGTDPKSTMDADLMRMKSAIESGRRPHDAWDRSPAPEISEGGLP
jgi:uncharacterized membrane protein